MIAHRLSDLIYTMALFAIIMVSIIWAYVRPDVWLWALSFAACMSFLIIIVFNAGRLEGIAHAEIRATLNASLKGETNSASVAISKLDLFDKVVADKILFKYELAHGLVPDGNSNDNPGLGPMDFSEWREWKDKEFNRTGTLWHNYPEGKPPIEFI